MTRIGADVYDNGHRVATFTRGRWYRMVEGDMAPLEPDIPAEASRIALLNAAPVVRRDLQADAALERTRVIDGLLSHIALERIRRA